MADGHLAEDQMNNKFFSKFTGDVPDKPVRVVSKPMAMPLRRPADDSFLGADSKRAAIDNAQVKSQQVKRSPQVQREKPLNIKPLDIKVPERIGRYQLGRRIGSGTCGVVHLSMDKLMGRKVAIKLSPVGEAHVSTGKVPGAQRAYQTELLAGGKLTHPNIVTVYDAGQFGDLNFLVMEAIEGKSLKEFGKGKKLMPASEALRIVSICCRALDYSHQQGILHRDIKPANIMLSRDGGVKLLDFGIAVGLTEDGVLNKKGPTLGTPNYMSPEQVLGKELTAQSDFYSLATVLYELLTGRQLFKTKKVKDLFRLIVHQKAPALNSLRPDLPYALTSVLARALEKRPQDRYYSGAQMAMEIEPHVQVLRSEQQRAIPRLRLIERLRQQAFFGKFVEEDVALLLARVSFRQHTKLETLLAKGSQERRLMIITDGAVRCSRDGQHIAVYGPGDCIGETGFLNAGIELCDYKALTQVSILEVGNDDLARLPPKVHLRYYRRISNVLNVRKSLRYDQIVDIALL